MSPSSEPFPQQAGALPVTGVDGSVPAAPPVLDPERWVDDHGDYLFHYALSRLRDQTRAEDFVQETLLAALKSHERFQGRSSERSWLTGILKNKILDHFRKAGRETSFTDLSFYEEEENKTFEYPGFADHWTPSLAPNDWSGASDSMDKEEFWKAFNGCTSKLPQRIAQVFLMREVDEVSGDEICATLNISQSNLWVMLHRARLALRRCLEVSWFGKEAESED